MVLLPDFAVLPCRSLWPRPPGTRHRPGSGSDRHGVAAVASCVVPARRPPRVVHAGGSTAPSVWLSPAILPPWTRSGSTR